mmetsp:Transcript_30312/g.90322  ORF Transcript_30312/g.90322 Transcript_30312/m.90322 type:complete len:384 (-) Transcript_30312:997-2148(-)
MDAVRDREGGEGPPRRPRCCRRPRRRRRRRRRIGRRSRRPGRASHAIPVRARLRDGSEGGGAIDRIGRRAAPSGSSGPIGGPSALFRLVVVVDVVVVVVRSLGRCESETRTLPSTGAGGLLRRRPPPLHLRNVLLHLLVRGGRRQGRPSQSRVPRRAVHGKIVSAVLVRFRYQHRGVDRAVLSRRGSEQRAGGRTGGGDAHLPPPSSFGRWQWRRRWRQWRRRWNEAGGIRSQSGPRGADDPLLRGDVYYSTGRYARRSARHAPLPPRGRRRIRRRRCLCLCVRPRNPGGAAADLPPCPTDTRGRAEPRTVAAPPDGAGVPERVDRADVRLHRGGVVRHFRAARRRRRSGPRGRRGEEGSGGGGARTISGDGQRRERRRRRRR